MPDKNFVRSSSAFIAQALTNETGDPWSVDTTHDVEWNAKLNGPDGQTLFLDYGYGTPNRIEISGSYPRDTAGELVNHENHKIGASAARPPEAIAKEIKRRLLPLYVEELAKVRITIARRDEHTTGRRVLALELGAIIGTQPRERGDRSFVDLPSALKGFGEFEITGPDSVTLHFRYASPEIARALARAIAQAD